MKVILTVIVLLFMILATPVWAAEYYAFDIASTTISFSVSHLGFSKISGKFTDFDGNFSFSVSHPEESSVDIIIRPAGIKTSDSDLDDDLQGKHWFNAAQFPEMHFVSTNIQIINEHTALITGNLTLRGITKPLRFTVHFTEAGEEITNRKYITSFEAEGVIKRLDFGMRYLIPLVGNEVHLFISAKGIELDKKN